MIYLKTPEQLQLMREAARLVSLTMGEVARHIAPGVTTRRLDNIAREFIRDNGGLPACLGYEGFPGTLCIEINETVVHGFPSNYQIRDNDIVGIDTVVELNGYCGDMAYTFPMPMAPEPVIQLCRTTYESLYIGIQACRPGKRVGDISNAIQTYCQRQGYTIVREMTGHGIGQSMHEDPAIPNYGRRSTGPVLRNGMCICIEPMVNLGSQHIIIEADGWTCRTRDRKPSAHYEHTVALHDSTTEILTTFDYIHQAFPCRFTTNIPSING